MSVAQQTVTETFTVRFEDADSQDVGRLGGKGAGLAEMTAHGFPVPPGFVITTAACRHFLDHGVLPPGFDDQVAAQLALLERRTGKSFGAGPEPLLLSVRSGAPVSMPGMMDTILDLGLSRESAVQLAEATHDTRFVADLVRRFHTMYAETVLGALEGPDGVMALLDGFRPDDDAGDAFDRMWAFCRDALEDQVDEPVPTDPRAQLRGAIEAVFGSWNTRRARTYRAHHKISDDVGTAVVVQMMVFGNLGDDSGSGVAFTRDPITGKDELYGEFLISSQGEDVVSGEFTPVPIREAEQSLPGPFADLRKRCAELERRRGDVLDIEFTIERSRLYFLQVRSAKRTAEAAVRIANDMWGSEVVDPLRALSGVSTDHIRQIQRPRFVPDEIEAARGDGRVVTVGIGACPGQVHGALCFDADAAKEQAEQGTAVILARPNTSPADLHGMIAAEGIVTATGGSTSHAAVVARALGTTCVVGCGDLDIDPAGGTLRAGDIVLRAGDQVSLDGTTGELFSGTLPSTGSASVSESFTSLLDRCRRASGATVLARVTLPGQAAEAQAIDSHGMVTALDDVLAAAGRFEALAAALSAGATADTADFAAVESIVAEEFEALLAATAEADMTVRAFDFLADDTHELLDRSLLSARPQLALPLGVPGFVEAQLGGLARAADATGRTAPLGFALRHVTDVGEARELTAAHRRVLARYPKSPVVPGVYATSASAVRVAAELAEEAPVVWLDLKLLMARDWGIPAWLLLTAQPLDDYLRAGRLNGDPRAQLGDGVRSLLESLTAAPGPMPGIRLSMPVADSLVAELYAVGCRTFAADLAEVQPLTLALGRAALAAG